MACATRTASRSSPAPAASTRRSTDRTRSAAGATLSRRRCSSSCAAGAFYGWPGCWPNARTLRLSGRCRGVTAPAAYLEPHSSADGLAFYTGRSFPRAYAGNVFIAEWGEYLSDRFGRRVVRVQLAPDGHARSVSTFAEGFAHPLALLVDRNGGLLVADWGRGLVYRIQARGRP